jgi:hypothetical protein
MVKMAFVYLANLILIKKIPNAMQILFKTKLTLVLPVDGDNGHGGRAHRSGEKSEESDDATPKVAKLPVLRGRLILYRGRGRVRGRPAEE